MSLNRNADTCAANKNWSFCNILWLPKVLFQDSKEQTKNYPPSHPNRAKLREKGKQEATRISSPFNKGETIVRLVSFSTQ